MPQQPAKTATPDAKCDPAGEEEQNVAFPLDLCMKKQEPTFEVTSSLLSSYMPTLTSAAAKKRPFQTMGGGGLVPGAMGGGGIVKPAPPKRRGRKPKVVQQVSRMPPTAHSEKVRQRQRVSLSILFRNFCKFACFRVAFTKLCSADPMVLSANDLHALRFNDNF